MGKVTPRSKAMVIWAAMLVWLVPQLSLAWQSSSPPPQETMARVNDYWIDQNKNGGGLGPSSAAYHLGNLAMYRAFCLPGAVPALEQRTCEKYLAHALDWANRHGWKLNTAKKEPDNQAPGQAYIELYEWCQKRSLATTLREKCEQTTNETKLAAISRSVDATMQRCFPNPNAPRCLRDGDRRYSWTWVDAIFMAAPMFSRFGADQGLPHHLPHASDVYFDTLFNFYSNLKDDAHRLYDAGERLWFRDANSVYRPDPEPCPKTQPRCRTQNDKKSFWSRGNGWVMAALPRILDDHPPDRAHRAEYRARLREMAKTLQARQRADGFWNVSLDDPNDFPGPETSGTAMFTYAMAWGINRGVLKDTYMPVVLKAWDGLVRIAVASSGKLGYVQGPADEPCDWMRRDQRRRSPFKQRCTWNDRDDTYVRRATHAYGVGPFLLAGSEVAKLPCVDWQSPSGISAPCLQAEDADDIGGGARVESAHQGYNGSGYVNFTADGSYIEWRQVDGGAGGNVTLSFRHALRPSASRTACLIVNGDGCQEITFASTGAWDNWKRLEVDVPLENSATNTIRIETTGQDCANIDELRLIQ